MTQFIPSIPSNKTCQQNMFLLADRTTLHPPGRKVEWPVCPQAGSHGPAPCHLVATVSRPIPCPYLLCYLTGVCSAPLLGSAGFHVGCSSELLLPYGPVPHVYSASDVFRSCCLWPLCHLCGWRPVPQVGHHSILISLCIIHLQSLSDRDPIWPAPSTLATVFCVTPPSGPRLICLCIQLPTWPLLGQRRPSPAIANKICCSQSPVLPPDLVPPYQDPRVPVRPPRRESPPKQNSFDLILITR